MEIQIEQLGLLLHEAARAMRKRFERRSAALGLSSAQWRLLVHVTRMGQSTQARLADRLEIEPISVSRLVDRMEVAGWVRREPDPTDRRVRIVVPTEKALQAAQEIRLIAAEVYDEALAGVSDSVRQNLVVGLNAIVNNLSEGDCACVPTCGEATK